MATDTIGPGIWKVTYRMARQSADTVEDFSTGENFADLFNEVFSDGPLEGSVLKGTVIALENDAAVIAGIVLRR